MARQPDSDLLMYERFYQLRAEPFRLSPDHYFAYAHKGFAKARAYMAYAYLRAEGFVMVTGRPGTGKTTLIGALVEQLADDDVSTANLVCTQLEADDLLKMVAYEFGIDGAAIPKGELLQRLTQRLKSWHRDGRRALLIVDEAQALSVSAMEELRLLTNIQGDGKPLLQIFLLGQPELRELILSPQLEQVHQRIVAASHLEPLQREETEAYIRHRLEAVGWAGDPRISNAVFPLVYKFSEGIPRRINLICSRLFLHCAVEQRHEVTVRDVREVVGELQGENLAAGARLTARDFNVADSFDDPVPDPDRDPGHGAGPGPRAQLASAGAGRGPVAVGGESVSVDEASQSRWGDEDEPRMHAVGGAGTVTARRKLDVLRKERGTVVNLPLAARPALHPDPVPAESDLAATDGNSGAPVAETDRAGRSEAPEGTGEKRESQRADSSTPEDQAPREERLGGEVPSTMRRREGLLREAPSRESDAGSGARPPKRRDDRDAIDRRLRRSTRLWQVLLVGMLVAGSLMTVFVLYATRSSWSGLGS
jgi:putative secretion ATPase (PEP-CTERM system associated)